MWHTDWNFLNEKWHISYTDDRSRRIMATGEFDNATEENAIFLLYQGILLKNRIKGITNNTTIKIIGNIHATDAFPFEILCDLDTPIIIRINE